jgi:hypothetical protein
VAFLNPLRKLFYNIVTTGLSIAVASVIDTVDLLQVFRTMLALHGGFFDFIGRPGFRRARLCNRWHLSKGLGPLIRLVEVRPYRGALFSEYYTPTRTKTLTRAAYDRASALARVLRTDTLLQHQPLGSR